MGFVLTKVVTSPIYSINFVIEKNPNPPYRPPISFSSLSSLLFSLLPSPSARPRLLPMAASPPTVVPGPGPASRRRPPGGRSRPSTSSHRHLTAGRLTLPAPPTRRAPTVAFNTPRAPDRNGIRPGSRTRPAPRSRPAPPLRGPGRHLSPPTSSLMRRRLPPPYATIRPGGADPTPSLSDVGAAFPTDRGFVCVDSGLIC